MYPTRSPRNHYHEIGEMTRRDGETASWRWGGVSPPFFGVVFAAGGRRGELK